MTTYRDILTHTLIVCGTVTLFWKWGGGWFVPPPPSPVEITPLHASGAVGSPAADVFILAHVTGNGIVLYHTPS